jgi:hypothetical protein
MERKYVTHHFKVHQLSYHTQRCFVYINVSDAQFPQRAEVL